MNPVNLHTTEQGESSRMRAISPPGHLAGTSPPTSLVSVANRLTHCSLLHEAQV